LDILGHNCFGKEKQGSIGEKLFTSFIKPSFSDLQSRRKCGVEFTFTSFIRRFFPIYVKSEINILSTYLMQESIPTLKREKVKREMLQGAELALGLPSGK
jgi:hypothetical protein